jgi:hypothetical protein
MLAWASRPPRRVQRFVHPDLPRLIAETVEDIGARPWMNAVCLPQALAAQAMLRRRGVASKLCLGVMRESGALAAHAWVEIGGNIIIGRVDQGFSPLAQFG